MLLRRIGEAFWGSGWCEHRHLGLEHEAWQCHDRGKSAYKNRGRDGDLFVLGAVGHL